MTANQSSGKKRPSTTAYPAGVCIQLLAERIQKVENSVPAATITAAKTGSHCGTRLRPNTTPPNYTIGELGTACAARTCRGNIMHGQARVISFNEMEEVMRTHRFSQAARWMTALLLASFGGVALAQSDPQKLVDKADTTFQNFMRDPDMTWLQQNIGRARGVLIAPEFFKAGFIFGGSA